MLNYGRDPNHLVGLAPYSCRREQHLNPCRVDNLSIKDYVPSGPHHCLLQCTEL